MWCKNCARLAGVEGKVTYHTEVADWFFNNYKSWGVERIGDSISTYCTPKDNRFLVATLTDVEPEDATKLYYNFFDALNKRAYKVKNYTEQVFNENSALVKLKLYWKSEAMDTPQIKAEFHRALDEVSFFVWIDGRVIYEKSTVPSEFPTYEEVMSELEKLEFNELLELLS